MSYNLFYALLIIRLTAPPIIFHYIHPFYAMILNEGVVDGLIAPHHIFTNLNMVPNLFLKHRKPYYDLPLDAWGFLNSLQPLVCKKHNYNNVFKGYEKCLTILFVWRQIGIVLLYIFKNPRILALFPNFYLGVYIAIAGCSLYKIKNKNTINSLIISSILLVYARELMLIKTNIQLNTVF